ncbi:MAG: TolC family protein [Elusimicrobia bacterium]|nr:TolC family protein [Elusimicrobiota bacterium]
MPDKIKYVIPLFLYLLSSCIGSSAGQEGTPVARNVRILTIEEFLETAVRNDTVFEEILIDELALKYSKGLGLPAGDLVLDVKSRYEFSHEEGGSDPSATIALSRLFPYNGTSVSAEYTTAPSIPDNTSEVTLTISQPVAKNAFGRNVRMQDRLMDKQDSIARYQIIEAYEDYMAVLITAYYSWYLAYGNLRIGESSYNQSLKLLDNIKDRQKSKIALPIDVNKINIQVLSKKETLIDLEHEYKNILNFIRQATRYNGADILEPEEPFAYREEDISFKEDYSRFVERSRTYGILKLLEEKHALLVDIDSDDLLPSTNILLGYAVEGEGAGLKDPDAAVFAGLSVSWPIPDMKGRSELEATRIEEKKNQVKTANTHVRIKTDLEEIFIGIEKERELITLAEDKIDLAERILSDEEKNYSYGKVSLNDLIAAVNRVDETRFYKILHSSRLKILETEWLRMTDRLVSEKGIYRDSETE